MTEIEYMNDTDTVVTSGALEAVSQSLAVGLTRAEIDQQIATAKQYPRSLKNVVTAIMSLATLDKESAEECMYALPRGGKPIKGPSIRFAEILKQSYGNCRAAARVVHVDRVEKYVEAEGIFHDLETNAATSARVRRRISGKDGRLYNDDMIIVTGNAACSIALRNAILAGVPKPLWRRAYDAVQSAIVGDIKTLAESRDKAVKAFGAVGITPEQVFSAIGVGGEEDITTDHIVTLRAMFSSLKNGEATVEEMFVGTVSAKSGHERVENPLDDTPAPSGAADTKDQQIDPQPVTPADGGGTDATAPAPPPVSRISAGGGADDASIPAFLDRRHDAASLPERLNKALWDCSDLDQIDLVYEEKFAEEVNQLLETTGLERALFEAIIQVHQQAVEADVMADRGALQMAIDAATKAIVEHIGKASS